MRRIAMLGRVSEEPGCLTRTFCSPAMRRANDLAGRWMREAGMTVRQDPVGNLIGRYVARGPKSKVQSPKSKRTEESKILLLGSHLDTVRNAGRFDGALGVVLAIACVAEFNRRRLRLPFTLEVIGFADEEGVRYQSAWLGSRAVAGALTRADLRRKDAAGITMADAIRGFGGKPDQLGRARYEPRRLLGYFEAHIEQGPVLERNRLPVGIVNAIAGQSRFRLTFSGRAGHAGTTPMLLRRDALCAAAQFILNAERYARETPGLVATVGELSAAPNASNVIPGEVTLTLEVRHQQDAVRRVAGERLEKAASQIGRARGVRVSAERVQQIPSVPCDPSLSAVLQRAVEKHQSRILRLPSGAGHDAAVMARIAPVAMLFIRCQGGVSHHPGESVSLGDVGVALRVMQDFVRLAAEREEA